MIKSMTGFGSREAKIMGGVRFCVELKSSNHKFLDIVLRLPEGFLSLEDRIKKEIETKIKRGRVTCSVNIMGGNISDVFINKELLEKYILALKDTRRKLHIQDEPRIDTLLNLPGVLSLVEPKISLTGIWPGLKRLINYALDNLARAREKEGQALYVYLKAQVMTLKRSLEFIQDRFKKAIADKIKQIKTDEERSTFLKNADITEELARLTFHFKNFRNKLLGTGSIGKELDFIAQEMQREANTVAAKSFDTLISAQVVQIKSQIEKLREQLQNIE